MALNFERPAPAAQPALTLEPVETKPYDILEDRDQTVAKLVDSEEIDRLTSQIDIGDMTTIVTFGAQTVEEISKACWEHWDLQDEGFVNVRKPGGLAKGAHKLGYLPSTMDAYGYQAHDEEWVKNPPKPGAGGPAK